MMLMHLSTDWTLLPLSQKKILSPKNEFQWLFESGQVKDPDNSPPAFSYFQDMSDTLAIFPYVTDSRFNIIEKKLITNL